jgi:hypothetical protein
VGVAFVAAAGGTLDGCAALGPSDDAPQPIATPTYLGFRVLCLGFVFGFWIG